MEEREQTCDYCGADASHVNEGEHLCDSCWTQLGPEKDTSDAEINRYYARVEDEYQRHVAHFLRRL